MGAFWTIFNKEIRAIGKEKTIMLAIVIQLIIASLSSVILIGLMSFYDPSTIGQNTNIHLKIGIVGDDSSQLIRDLQRAHINTIYYDNPDNAQQDFAKGSLDAVIYVPPGTAGVKDMKLFLPESDSKSTVILMVLKEPFKTYENQLREASGVDVKYTDVTGRSSTTYEFLFSFIVPMLMLFPAFIAGSIVIDTLSEEFENKTIDTLLAAPVALKDMIGGKLAASVFIAVIQCILWAILLSFNRIYIQNVVLVLVMSGLIAAFVAAGSALIALYFKDRERSQFIYSVLLITVASLSYLVEPSPIGLITRLATGAPGVGAINVALYMVPLVLLLVLVMLNTKRLVALKA
ncbi:ABC transporter permease [Methanocella sp. MCL-LM]|uniref:ABC transporter permease n=1 Tax=Methanocella sp. MCL-LM TaxID=3412035 RepID=UPI003C73C6DB